MHKYYQENSDKLKKGMHQYLKHIDSEISQIFNKPYSECFQEIWEFYYSNILDKFPYIGGDSVKGTNYLTGSYYFVALAEVGKKYNLSLNQWGKLITTAFERHCEAIPKLIRKTIPFFFKREKLVYKILKRRDMKNHRNSLKNPGSFETQVQMPTEEFPINFHNTVCPLSNFAKEYGYMDYMPYLCNLDYVMSAKFGISLYREKTCADGDSYCDFKFKKNAPIPPYWPPHILNKNSNLK